MSGKSCSDPAHVSKRHRIPARAAGIFVSSLTYEKRSRIHVKTASRSRYIMPENIDMSIT